MGTALINKSTLRRHVPALPEAREPLPAGGPDYVPGPVGRPENSDITFTVAIVIRRHRLVPWHAPRHHVEPVTAPNPVPLPRRGPPQATSVFRSRRNQPEPQVSAFPICTNKENPRIQDMPSHRGPVHGLLVLAVTVEGPTTAGPQAREAHCGEGVLENWLTGPR